MATMAVHFKSILYSNYDGFREPLKVRFTNCPADRSIPHFSIRYLDGFTKGLVCQAICAIIDHLATWTLIALHVHFIVETLVPHSPQLTPPTPSTLRALRMTSLIAMIWAHCCVAWPCWKRSTSTWKVRPTSTLKHCVPRKNNCNCLVVLWLVIGSLARIPEAWGKRRPRNKRPQRLTSWGILERHFNPRSTVARSFQWVRRLGNWFRRTMQKSRWSGGASIQRRSGLYLTCWDVPRKWQSSWQSITINIAMLSQAGPAFLIMLLASPCFPWSWQSWTWCQLCDADCCAPALLKIWCWVTQYKFCRILCIVNLFDTLQLIRIYHATSQSNVKSIYINLLLEVILSQSTCQIKKSISIIHHLVVHPWAAVTSSLLEDSIAGHCGFKLAWSQHCPRDLMGVWRVKSTSRSRSPLPPRFDVNQRSSSEEDSSSSSDSDSCGSGVEEQTKPRRVV